MLASEKQIKIVRQERKYWQELADLLGWKLYGWSYKDECTYRNKRGWTVEIRGEERDDIVNAIRNAPRKADARKEEN
jgi:hypothetical protein